MWSGDSYNWRVNKSGGVIGTGPASDAEEDIALSLIFADLLVNKNVWQPHTSPKGATYAQRAQSMVDYIWNNIVESGKYLRPGNQWGGSAFVNPGYFAPAYYRIFNEFGQPPTIGPDLSINATGRPRFRRALRLASRPIDETRRHVARFDDAGL